MTRLVLFLLFIACAVNIGCGARMEATPDVADATPIVASPAVVEAPPATAKLPAKKKDAGELVTVLKVYDGDTLRVIWRGQKVRVRLIDVNAPEWNQPGGPEAKAALEEKLKSGKAYLFFPRGEIRDRYARLLARIEPAGANAE